MVDFGDGPVILSTLEEGAADYFCEHLKWPMYYTHPRTYLKLVQEVRDHRRVFYTITNPSNNARGIALDHDGIAVYPSKNVRKGLFVAEGEVDGTVCSTEKDLR